MFNLILLILKIIFLPLSSTKKEIILKLCIQAKELSLCRRKLEIQNKRIRFTRLDRLFYALISQIFNKIKFPGTLIKPETVLKWTKDFIKHFWIYPRRTNPQGRPGTPEDIKQIVLKIKNQNLHWGYKRISDELIKLDIHLDKNTVKKIIKQYRKRGMVASGLTWKKFIKNHIDTLHAMDFFTVTTMLGATFYVFFIIQLKTRMIIQYRITNSPSRFFVMNQLRGFIEDHDGEKIYLIHDNDPAFKYINYDSLGIKNIKTSVEAPNMNSYAERFVGSIRREALDWFVIFTESQLQNIVKQYIFYYNNYRIHQDIKDTPVGYQPHKEGKVVSMPVLFEMHHRYYRKAS